MTREERHIAVLSRLLENMDVYDSVQPTEERKKAIKAAISALEQEPCEDAISRNNVITTICQYGVTRERAGQYMITANEMKQDLVDLIDSLPSVTLSRQVIEDIKAEIYKERTNISFNLSEEKSKWVNSGIYDGLVWAEEIIDKHIEGRK